VRRWVQAAAAAALIALVLGRWMAVSTADDLWSQALGIAATHGQIHRVQTMLWVTAFLAAAVWCIGNLLLVYRSIRSVHVPRKLGNLEILEAVPRRFLFYGAIVVGILLAVALSHGATDWWYARALTEYRAPLGTNDPVLGRDISYYLFRLPWHRAVHTFATLLAGVVLALSVVLYAAVGAIRWSRRRLRVTDLARWHLAGLLCAFALMLFWGYRLEPAEYVAGIHDVPGDTVLTAVRIPASRMLSAAALLVLGGSALWFWSSRVIVVALPWALLAMLSIAGHYVVPSFAAAVRSTEELTVSEIEADRGPLAHIAYGTTYTEMSLDPALAPEPRLTPSANAVFDRAPLWDAFAVTVLLDRLATAEPHITFSGATLGMYRSRSGEPVPVYVAARQVDLSAVSDTAAALTWERVHVRPYEAGSGAVAVQAHRTSGVGLPLFIPDLDRPAQAVEQLTELALVDPRMATGPGVSDFAVFDGGTSAPRGVIAGGFWRRLALAWSLQSPQLVTADAVADSSIIVWHRDVVERLNRYAPFARFGEPRAAVVGGRLYWISNGYVSAQGFPLSPTVRWRTERVRYLRSSLVGIVEASTGETSVYLLRDHDPLSLAWSQILPEVVRTASQLLPGLLDHLPYPVEALSVQLDLLRRTVFPTGTVERPVASVVAGPLTAGQDSYWWVGRTARDTVVRLRLFAPLEKRESGLLAGLVDGTVRGMSPMLELFRADGPTEILGPSQMARRFSQLRGDLTGIDGKVRMVPFQGGVASLQSTYLSREAGGAPQVVDISVGFRGGIGSGPTLPTALDQLRAEASPTGMGSREWMRAKQWFERMDAARRLGDWTAFGRAYEELRQLLIGLPDSVP